jgi:putative transposase
MDHLHRHARTGRPLGSEDFIKSIEARLGRVLRPQKPGPKARSRDARTSDMLSGLGEE